MENWIYLFLRLRAFRLPLCRAAVIFDYQNTGQEQLLTDTVIMDAVLCSETVAPTCVATSFVVTYCGYLTTLSVAQFM
jgi:hypothetical protein